MNKLNVKKIINWKTVLSFLLSVILCFSLTACKKDDASGKKTDEKEQNQVLESTEPVMPEKKLETQVEPVDTVNEILNADTIDAIIKDQTQIGDLEKDENYKGVQLIIKHDNELKAVPIQYPFANWLSEQKKPVLFECIADYSEPAKKSLPYLYGIADQYKDKLLVCKVDVNEAKELIDLFKLEYLPTYFISRDLTLYQVGTSFDPYANPSLIDKIEPVLNQK